MRYSEIHEKYTRDNLALLKYMKSDEFDVYNHWYYVARKAVKELNDNDGEAEGTVFGMIQNLTGMDLDAEEYDDIIDNINDNVDPEVFYKLPKDIQDEYAEEITDYVMSNDPAESSTTTHMMLSSDNLLKRNTWLVHFSDNAYDIARNGFKYGVDQMDRLGLTTYLSDREKEYGGFNFSFEEGSRYAKWAASQGKYGKEAVIFQNSGVKAWHHGDEEDQVIFYGKDVDPRGIVYLAQDYGDWIVQTHPLSKRYGQDSKEGGIFKGDFEECTDWVTKNITQYRRIITGY